MASDDNSARTFGSGTLDVFGTPGMIALMENTALKSIESELEEGQGTVGISLNVKHTAATPLGMKVSCDSELVEVDGRKLTFRLTAYDEKGEIGEGIHERFIVDEARFVEKANGRR